MIIANPIYDTVFKRLMEDRRVARFFIETLLEETVEDVDVKPQELIYAPSEKPASLTLFRLDFVATIKTANGEHKKVLIEIQKAKSPIDIPRFRGYLGEQYKRLDEIQMEDGKRTVALPIITIYLLGFTLPNIKSPAIKIARQYIDLMTHSVIPRKSEFVEKLTHDCYIVQIPRIQPKFSGRLGQLLSIFEQNYFVDDRGMVKEYNHEINDSNIRNITDILHHAGVDAKKRKEIEDEQEVLRSINFMTGNMNDQLVEQIRLIEDRENTIDEQEKALEEKDKALEEKDKALEDKDKTLMDKENAMAEKEKALKDKDKAMEDLARQIEELKNKLNKNS